jgi:hypothetical protein
MMAEPVTLKKQGIATAVLTGCREMCELRPNAGVVPRKTPVDRFHAKDGCNLRTGCWEWIASKH